MWDQRIEDFFKENTDVLEKMPLSSKQGCKFGFNARKIQNRFSGVKLKSIVNSPVCRKGIPFYLSQFVSMLTLFHLHSKHVFPQLLCIHCN